jgi:uncharacterized protein YecA (UPF0149 family)
MNFKEYLEEKATSRTTNRNKRVKVSYNTIDGKRIEDEIFSDFTAQVWQHEINHLNGIAEEIVDIHFDLPIPKKINRNDLCPCGSGKKFKKCCM